MRAIQIFLIVYMLLITAWGGYFLFKLIQGLLDWLRRRRRQRGGGGGFSKK